MSQFIETGTIASFTVGDVACPDAMQVLRQTGPELAVSGKVVYLSDWGDQKNYFAIVDVGGIHAPLIVPVNCLRVVHPAGAEMAAGMEQRTHDLASGDWVSTRTKLGVPCEPLAEPMGASTVAGSPAPQYRQ